jgi:hypothetical protein
VLSARARGVITSRYRRTLTRAALSAVAAGLPVVPGAWWSVSAQRFECDLAGCPRSGLHPAVHGTGAGGRAGIAGVAGGLSAHAVRTPEAVLARWNRQPYSVLVPTGEACDVVDVPASLGRALAVRLDARSALGPVIAAGTRWFFLTAPGGQLPGLGGDVLVHGQGSWIMLPPSLGPGGDRAGWLVRPVRRVNPARHVRPAGPVSPTIRVSPARYGWSLPDRDEVIRLIAPVSVLGLRSGRPKGARQASPTPA